MGYGKRKQLKDQAQPSKQSMGVTPEYRCGGTREFDVIRPNYTVLRTEELWNINNGGSKLCSEFMSFFRVRKSIFRVEKGVVPRSRYDTKYDFTSPYIRMM